MNERTIQQLVDRLNSSDPDFDDCTDAAIILLRQHAEIKRLKSDAELVNSCAKNLAIALHRKNFSHITKWEPLPDTLGLITQIDNMTCWTRDDVARLTADRDAATASAVLAERTANAAQLRKWADELGFDGSSWCWKTPGGLLYRAAEMISDRSKP